MANFGTRVDRIRDELAAIHEELNGLLGSTARSARTAVHRAQCELDLASDWAHAVDTRHATRKPRKRSK